MMGEGAHRRAVALPTVLACMLAFIHAFIHAVMLIVKPPAGTLSSAALPVKIKNWGCVPL